MRSLFDYYHHGIGVGASPVACILARSDPETSRRMVGVLRRDLAAAETLAQVDAVITGAGILERGAHGEEAREVRALKSEAERKREAL